VLRRKLDALRDWAATTIGGLAVVGAPPTPIPEAVVEVYAAVADRLHIADEARLEAILRRGGCVFEGAQGVLLDEWRGFHPYTTWSTTTFDNVTELTGGGFTRLGVLRCFTTRHGAGPMVTEDPALTAALIDPHNPTGQWQGAFRVGHFDAVAHRYAVEVCGGVDGLALTHLDTATSAPAVRLCLAYTIDGTEVDRLRPGPFRDLDHQEALTASLLAARPRLDPISPGSADGWIAAVERAVGAPVLITSHGPTAAEKRVRVGGWPAARRPVMASR
jgi:adenylosuccinate synthase